MSKAAPQSSEAASAQNSISERERPPSRQSAARATRHNASAMTPAGKASKPALSKLHTTVEAGSRSGSSSPSRSSTPPRKRKRDATASGSGENSSAKRKNVITS